jgi:type II secretion system protein G
MQASLERLRARREHLEGAEGGFTLIELLIVIVILGILAAIVVFAVQNLTQQSSNASCQSDFKTVEVAAEAYKAQINTYPGSGTQNGISDLLTTANAPTSNQTVGPWLKDTPGSSKYQVVVGSSNLPGSSTQAANTAGGAADTAWGTVVGTGPKTMQPGDGVVWIGTPGPQGTGTATKWESGSGATLTATTATPPVWTASASAPSASSQSAQTACTNV